MPTYNHYRPWGRGEEGTGVEEGKKLSLAKGLKKLRRERNWTQGELHRRTGLERSYITRLESGRQRNIGLRNAMLIARAFGLTVEEFADICEKAGRDPGIDEEAKFARREG